MDLFDLIKRVVVYLGVPTIVVAMIYIGKKLQVLDDLKLTTEKIKYNLKVVTDYLMKSSGGTFGPNDLQNYSLLRLSVTGAAFIKQLDFYSVLEEHKCDFFSYIDAENPKLKYDVELASIKSIYDLADEQYMGFLKIFFYNNPNRNMRNTAPTLGICVRDEYLEEHPEIKE
jgi:hypothetical protein